MWALGCIMFELLTGYHPFKEDSKIAILYRIFKTMGTPSHNILEYPTLMANQDFVDIMNVLPQWEAISLAEMILEEPTLMTEEEQHGIGLLSLLLQIEPSKRPTAR